MDLTVFLAAAATVTKAVDFTRNAVDGQDIAPKWLWNLEAFGLGIFATYSGALNLMPGHRFGMLITGLAIGAAGSGFHEVFDFFSGKAKGK